MNNRTDFITGLLSSYQHWTGSPLISDEIPQWKTLSQEALLKCQTDLLDKTATVIVGHGTEVDPILCYGNNAALKLWEMDEETFLSTPSKQTAETGALEKRAELLKRTNENGFVDNYHGIRISSSGKRFEIATAVIWNVLDSAGKRIGQAAAFSHWKYL